MDDTRISDKILSLHSLGYQVDMLNFGDELRIRMIYGGFIRYFSISNAELMQFNGNSNDLILTAIESLHDCFKPLECVTRPMDDML